MRPTHTVLSPTEVATRVWLVSGPEDSFSPRAAHLDDRHQARSLPEWRMASFLAGRAALRVLLRSLIPEAEDRCIRPDQNGRPVLVGRSDIGISVSHTGGGVAAMLGADGRRVGVDVQLPPERVSPSLVTRCVGRWAEDFHALDDETQARELAWTWTVQESCVKAEGSGFAGRPWTIDVPVGAAHGRWNTYSWISLREQSHTPLSCAFSAPTSSSDEDRGEP